MEAAVNVASTLIDKGAILLSPACASFDMFDDFEQRGRVFKDCVYIINPNYVYMEKQILSILLYLHSCCDLHKKTTPVCIFRVIMSTRL
jgi:hypothetical protein